MSLVDVLVAAVRGSWRAITPIMLVKTGHEGVLYRRGKIVDSYPAGWHRKRMITESWEDVDVTPGYESCGRQAVESGGCVYIVEPIVRWRVCDAARAYTQMGGDYGEAVKQAVRAAMCAIAETHDELSWGEIADEAQRSVRDEFLGFGIEIETVELAEAVRGRVLHVTGGVGGVAGGNA